MAGLSRPNAFERGMNISKVIVVIGAGLIGQAIARRVGVGKHVVLADSRPENANAAAEVRAAHRPGRWIHTGGGRVVHDQLSHARAVGARRR